MLEKLEFKLNIQKKRNLKLITPCCRKSNSDGKFVNYKELPEIYGYCHSCGKTTLPQAIYKNEKGDLFQYNVVTNSFERFTGYVDTELLVSSNLVEAEKKVVKLSYVDLDIVNRLLNNPEENNLLKYLRTRYNDSDVNKVKKNYFLGSSKKGGTVFWTVNRFGKAQKAKVVFYDLKGKRTNYFQVPYKNDDGYHFCLFGEHLIDKPYNKAKPLALVESEKTALVCSIHLPNYVWLAYGGINGLTEKKLQSLSGRKVILVPDMSENAVQIMRNKIPHLKELNIDVELWDMTQGKHDDQLKEEGWYNCDLEDVFRYFL